MAISKKWRILVTDYHDAGGVYISVILLAGPEGEERYDYTIMASSYNGANVPANVDPSVWDEDTVWGVDNSSLPAWIEFEYPTYANIYEYELETNEVSVTGQNGPKTFSLQYYDEDTTSWVTTDTQTNVSTWGDYEDRPYTVASTVANTRWRLYFTGFYQNYATFNEIKIYATNGGANLCPISAIISNYEYSGHEVKSAADEDAGTYWRCYKSSTLVKWFECEFSSAISDLYSYSIKSGPTGDVYCQGVSGIELKYWDGAAWQSYNIQTGLAVWSADEERTFVLEAAPVDTTGDAAIVIKVPITTITDDGIYEGYMGDFAASITPLSLHIESGIVLPLYLHPPAISITGSESLYPTIGSAALTFPAPIGVVNKDSTYGSGLLRISKPAISATSTGSHGRFDVSVPKPMLLAASTTTYGRMSVSVAIPELNVLSTYTLGVATLEIPKPKISQTWELGTIGQSLNVILPIISIGISGYESTTGALAIQIPTPVITLTYLWASWPCLVVNTDNMLLSEYVEYHFLDFAKIGETYIGLHVDGNLYSFGGNTDAGAMIESIIETAQDDMGSGRPKRLLGMVAGLRADGETQYRSHRKDGYGEYIEIPSTDGELKEVRKIETEKMELSRAIGIEFSNLNGVDFTIDSLELMVRADVRR